MGVFDWVMHGPLPCPECAAQITSWQSKTGPRRLTVVQPWEVKDFHGICQNGHYAAFDVVLDGEPQPVPYHIVARQ